MPSALAAKLGITWQEVQEYEKGTNRIGASRLFRIARVLDVRVGSFFEGEAKLPGYEPRTEGVELSDRLQSKETLGLILAYYRITDPRIRRKRKLPYQTNTKK